MIILVKNKEIKDDVIYMVRITNISGKCDSDDMMMILMRIENCELTKERLGDNDDDYSYC